MSFGMLGALTLASWGTLGRSRDNGERKKGHFEVQAWTFIDFGDIDGPIRKFFGYLWTKKDASVYACFKVVFSDDFWV